MLMRTSVIQMCKFNPAKLGWCNGSYRRLQDGTVTSKAVHKLKHLAKVYFWLCCMIYELSQRLFNRIVKSKYVYHRFLRLFTIL